MAKSVTALALVVFSLIAHGASVTPLDVQTFANARGNQAALRKFFSCEPGDYDGYAQVAKGDKAWLDVALRLLPSSDACYSEGLHDSIARALFASPSLVLPLVDSNPRLSASSICLPFMSDEEPKKKHIAYLKKLEEKISTVEDSASQLGKKRCLDEIRSLRKLL